MGNEHQVRDIERYHRHLQRLGRAKSIEDTCRQWVKRFAALWRRHHDDPRSLRRRAARDSSRPRG